jgi:hypothetical protein
MKSGQELSQYQSSRDGKSSCLFSASHKAGFKFLTLGFVGEVALLETAKIT